MRVSQLPFVLALTAVLAAGCAVQPQQQMKKESTSLDVTCDPEVLEAHNGKIEATIAMSFPGGYFNPQAVMVITPVLVYSGGHRSADTFLYQGQDVKANYKVVKTAGSVMKEKVSFDFVPGMEQCYLELRCTAVFGAKKVNLPAIKVADGCRSTYKLALVSGEYEYKPDGYEMVTHLSTGTNLLYDVNSAVVKNNSRNNTAMAIYKSYLSDIEGDSRYKITNTEIVAYTSPEGGEDFNAKLSDRRAGTAVEAWNRMSGSGVDSLSVRSVGQDWDGFRQAVADSDIEDKDLILRILSMYSDPAVRESEIRNLSFIYDDIKKEVFPGLRRAEFVVSADHIGYNDEELKLMGDKRLGSLSEPEILRLAAITDNIDTAKFYYHFAVERFKSDVALYNLAAVALDQNRAEVASVYVNKVPRDTSAINVLGVIELRRGNIDDAARLFGEGTSKCQKMNMGTIKILNGEYEEAAQLLRGTGSENEALALVLAGHCEEAAAITPSDERGWYIKAIAHARMGDRQAVKDALAKASEDPVFAQKAAKDVEFVEYR